MTRKLGIKLLGGLYYEQRRNFGKKQTGKQKSRYF